jgi:hypothetical protein
MSIADILAPIAAVLMVDKVKVFEGAKVDVTTSRREGLPGKFRYGVTEISHVSAFAWLRTVWFNYEGNAEGFHQNKSVGIPKIYFIFLIIS